VSAILTILKRILIVVGIAIAFALGLFGAIYLSLRSSETRVPDIVGKDRASAENTISDAGLNFRVRATRPTAEAKPDTVLIQLPHAGEVVKVGQTVAVDISRATSDGEPSTPANTNSNEASKPEDSSTSNSSSNSNSNSEKKPTNRNSNNSNANKNANRLANRNQNTNRAVNGNLNANTNSTPVHTNANSNLAPVRPTPNRGAANTNANRRPAAPLPTP
jgi:PASTA domain-containing protein